MSQDLSNDKLLSGKPPQCLQTVKDRSPLSAFTTAAPKNVTEHET